ncbi:MAG TPA: hypothetical protein VKY65_11245 [Alphaproteobacteria bacterium]|nr:hypothetical protein [Alphaproteobacteria bacterium]
MSRSLRPPTRSSAAQLWTAGGIEPPVREMLADPIVRAVMKRDKLRREDIEAILREARRLRRTTAKAVPLPGEAVKPTPRDPLWNLA